MPAGQTTVRDPSRGVWGSPRRTPGKPTLGRPANVLRPLSDRALRFQLAIKFSAKASDGRIASGRLPERSGGNAPAVPDVRLARRGAADYDPG
jgi:hypothetical protein